MRGGTTRKYVREKPNISLLWPKHDVAHSAQGWAMSIYAKPQEIGPKVGGGLSFARQRNQWIC